MFLSPTGEDGKMCFIELIYLLKLLFTAQIIKGEPSAFVLGTEKPAGHRR